MSAGPAVVEAAALRADAQRNREAILEVARAALKQHKPFSMSAIARRAGVGQGTLYRHFRSREALIMAVHRQDVAELVQVAPLLLEQHPPLRALQLWLERLAAYGRIKHGLAGALHGVDRAQLEGEGYGPILGAITLLLEPNQRAGVLLADVDAQDLLLLVGFLWRIDLDDDWESRHHRLLQLVLAGLRVP